jgi:hypothetical protein
MHRTHTQTHTWADKVKLMNAKKNDFYNIIFYYYILLGGEREKQASTKWVCCY